MLTIIPTGTMLRDMSWADVNTRIAPAMALALVACILLMAVQPGNEVDD
jgi:hypothetical protein